MRSAFRPRFFLSLPEGLAGLPGTDLRLSASDERHARLVLRARPGDGCEVVLQAQPADSQSKSLEEAAPTAAGCDQGRPPSAGAVFAATFVDSGDGLGVRLEAAEPEAPPAVSVVLLQALPDLRSVDLIVEKGTEVGVDSFLLFTAEGSPSRAREGGEKKLVRWRRIAEEAAKQSKQLAVPPVTLAPSLEAALDRAAVWGARVLVLEPEGRLSLSETLDKVAGPEPRGDRGHWLLALAVGPEGGWSAAELALIEQRRLPSASLGRRILRAETAGPVAAAVARFALDDS